MSAQEKSEKVVKDRKGGSNQEQGGQPPSQVSGQSQTKAEKETRPEDEITGEGTGARAGEYS